jgi:hypothetical protein
VVARPKWATGPFQSTQSLKTDQTPGHNAEYIQLNEACSRAKVGAQLALF